MLKKSMTFSLFGIASIAVAAVIGNSFNMTASAAGPAASASPPPPAAALIPSGEYGADKAHAYLNFSYLHQGYSRPVLGFDAFDVRLTLDVDDPIKSKVFVNINPASIDAGTELFKSHLLSSRWFDVEKYPEIRFVSTSVESTADPKKWKLNGDLTIKGVTKPVTLDATLNRAGNGWWTNKPMLGFSATATIKRSAFGMGEYVPQISDDVNVMIELELDKMDNQ